MDYQISDLLPHLFWDVDPSGVEWEKHAKMIIEKVLMYGLIGDWRIINAVYGKEKIKETSKTIRSMDEVTLSFLCTLYDLKPEDFRCYRLRPYQPNFWE